jgi:hypothetical protein
MTDKKNTDEVRQVVFITDGAIGNEDELFSAIHDGLGRSRGCSRWASGQRRTPIS